MTTNNTEMENIVKNVMASPEMAEMKKAFIGTDTAPVSTQITYTQDLKNTVFEKAPYLRLVRSKRKNS